MCFTTLFHNVVLRLCFELHQNVMIFQSLSDTLGTQLITMLFCLLCFPSLGVWLFLVCSDHCFDKSLILSNCKLLSDFCIPTREQPTLITVGWSAIASSIYLQFHANMFTPAALCHYTLVYGWMVLYIINWSSRQLMSDKKSSVFFSHHLLCWFDWMLIYLFMIFQRLYQDLLAHSVQHIWSIPAAVSRPSSSVI